MPKSTPPHETLLSAFGDPIGLALIRTYVAAVETEANPDADADAIARAERIRRNLERTAETIAIARDARARLTGGDVVRFLGELIPRVIGTLVDEPDESDDTDTDTA